MGRGVRATILISDTQCHPYAHCYKFWRKLGVYVNSSYLNSTNLVKRKCLLKKNIFKKRRFVFKFS